MKHIGWCVLLLPLSGCLLLLASSPKQDGETCEKASDCESDNCQGNICIGSSCDDSNDCPDNFRCYHYDGDPIFGIGDGYRCRLACDANNKCPSQWTCETGDTYCTYVGPTVTVTVSNDHPSVGETVTFSGAFDPPQDDVTWTWTFYDPVVAGNILAMKTGSTVEMTFSTPGYSTWSVDATTPSGGEHYESGSIIACAPAGDACMPYAGDCCGQLSCNPATSLCESAP
ncbi:MAG TPA: PKD domain-containing protein [Kofleriaceae bacterium]|jgi:hypothetical protein|nr:PKD domain-containing protein [Kofleriaceae bacterium]